MARMTRTQVTLEEAEYHFLKAQAAEKGVSLSSIVRGLVRDRMQRIADSSPHVWDVAGLIAESDFNGKDHDAILTGHKAGTAAARVDCGEPADGGA
jgi:hypothetical protein